MSLKKSGLHLKEICQRGNPILFQGKCSVSSTPVYLHAHRTALVLALLLWDPIRWLEGVPSDALLPEALVVYRT